jgi:uncharacterized protein
MERDNPIGDDDMTWWGWEEAVVKLGLVELEPALLRVWAKPAYEQFNDEDRTGQLEMFRRAVADPSDATAFEEEELRAVDDPVEAISWIARREAKMAAWDAEHVAEHGPDTDAARDIRLTPAEQQWLGGLLVSQHVPASTMSQEMLDGFFTALVIGPDVVLPSQYFPLVWDPDGGEEPVWDSLEQSEYTLQLVTRHWNAIAARRAAGAEHRPFIDPFSATMPGEEWADGFAGAVQMQGAAWDRMFGERASDQLVMPILALCSDAPEEIRNNLPLDLRNDIIDQLPAMLQTIAAYWQQPQQDLARREPVRSTKMGRNEPCPCGSGRKYKKCCGLAPPQTLH